MPEPPCNGDYGDFEKPERVAEAVQLLQDTCEGNGWKAE